MYNIVHVLQWIVLIAGTAIIYKWVKKKILGIIVLVIVIFAMGALNISMPFDTPDDAINHLVHGKIVGTVEGQDSYCVVTSKGDLSCEITLLGREGNAYRVLDGFDYAHDTVQAEDGTFFVILSVNDTDDQFAYGALFIPAGSQVEVQDTNGTVFETVVTETGYSLNGVAAYAHVGPVDEDYGIHVTCTS